MSAYEKAWLRAQLTGDPSWARAVIEEWNVQPRTDSTWLVWQCGRFIPVAQSIAHDFCLQITEQWRKGR